MDYKTGVTHFWLIAAFLLIVCSTGTGKEPTYLSNDIIITEIDTGAYLVTHRFYWPCNSLLVRVSDNDFVWVDTPSEPQATKTAYKWIERTFGKIKVVEINTGFHWDNLGGNEFLLNQGVPVYGSTLTAKLIRERGHQEKQNNLEFFAGMDNKKYYETFKRMTFQPPNHTFDIEKGLVLDIGDEHIEVYYPGHTHTPDNVVVYFQKRKILFGGCMIKSLESKNPGYTADADMKQWPKSVRKVLKKYGQSRIVVPGHGKCGDIKLIKHTIELLDKANHEPED